MTDQGAGRERFRGRVGITAAESEPWWPERPQAPAGAPNVVVIAMDDTGFAHFGCYGSDIETPAIDRLAEGGLRYNNFHTTALCSPTRACLLTGRNHHSVGMRFLSNVDTGFSNWVELNICNWVSLWITISSCNSLIRFNSVSS